MTQVICAIEASRLPAASIDTVPVLLYGSHPPISGGRSIGGQLIAAVRRLGQTLPQPAFDFLSVALAVTAADTFVRRDDAADGWCRVIDLVVPVMNPALWTPVVPVLQKALHFLSGDMWSIDIQSGGRLVPEPQTRGRLIETGNHDCACLFSGGLDSTLGALDLVAQGHTPLLVSHSYPGDQKRQNIIWRNVLSPRSRFAANAHPVSPYANDTTMRTRSLNFLSYGALAGTALAGIHDRSVVLFVPENGWIAINPPLTTRRIGAHSTRTTHPYFLGLVQEMFTLLDIPVTIENPYRFRTKGEMVRDCLDQKNLAAVLGDTVSCGKWKRSWQQCGRCVPCLIRRAAIHAAGQKDATKYVWGDLARVMNYEDERDDLLAMLIALSRAQPDRLDGWAARSGPLPNNLSERAMQVDVFRRGLREMDAYLRSLGLVQ